MSQPNESPRYVTCRCQYCDKGIEFDANRLDVTGTAGNVLTGQKIACPHCGLETILFIPNDQKKINPQPAKSAPSSAPPPKKVVSQPPVTPQEASGNTSSQSEDLSPERLQTIDSLIVIGNTDCPSCGSTQTQRLEMTFITGISKSKGMAVATVLASG